MGLSQSKVRKCGQRANWSILFGNIDKLTEWPLLERDRVIQVNSSLLRQEASETNISDISQGDTFGLFVMLLGAVHKFCQRPKGVGGVCKMLTMAGEEGKGKC